MNEIGRQLGLNKFLVSRILRDPRGHLAKLGRWTRLERAVALDKVFKAMEEVVAKDPSRYPKYTAGHHARVME